MSETSDGFWKMSSVLDWAGQIGVIAGPYQSSDTRESWLARAARKAGITHRQCKALYYGEITDPKTSVAYGVLKAAEEARSSALKLAATFETAAGKMQNGNADVYREEILLLVREALRLRGQAR